MEIDQNTQIGPDGKRHATGSVPTEVPASGMKPLGYVQITDLAAAVDLGDIPEAATYANFQVEGGAVRYRDDGDDPTATVGVLLPDGSSMPYVGDLAAVKVIEVAAGAILNVSYYEVG